MLSRGAKENGVRFHRTSGGGKMERREKGEGDEGDGCQAIRVDVVLAQSGGSTMT